MPPEDSPADEVPADRDGYEAWEAEEAKRAVRKYAPAGQPAEPSDMICEEHPDKPWPHDDCAGPGMPKSNLARMAEPSDIESRKAELPMQPIIRDSDGVLRFKKNALVRHLLDWARERGYGLNELAIVPASQEDREQLMQLIGYSLSGYGELSCVSDESYERADKAADIFTKG